MPRKGAGNKGRSSGELLNLGGRKVHGILMLYPCGVNEIAYNQWRCGGSSRFSTLTHQSEAEPRGHVLTG